MKLWFDTDPGVDDALALTLLLARPEWQLVGLSSVFGNAGVAQTTRNAAGLLALLGRPEVPLHRGAAGPLRGEARLAAEVHGGDGLSGLAAELPGGLAERATPAAEALLEASRREDALHVVAVGPLTNIAQALRLDPGLATRLASLTVMGGAFGLFGFSGNVSVAAEANVHNDPRAAAEVFAAPWRCLRVVGLDATHRVRIEPERLEALRHAGGRGAWLWRAVQPYLDFYAAWYGQRVLVAHDATALLALLDPGLFHWRQGPLRVVEGGLAHGQSLQDWQQLGRLDPEWCALPAHAVAQDAAAEPIIHLCLDAWARP
ncbi:nucleoside hydrolase [Pseudorhodoferax sp.]|jgi:purine nucleosidase|uniref:nucleoside hydrolase n=1 Tax=Pseudorhodoferax sp. TaxID=1993553 RepID=UPI002DD61DD9|nr:nucleoside hydrolase [Pseudorhodoferax sp.]